MPRNNRANSSRSVVPASLERKRSVDIPNHMIPTRQVPKSVLEELSHENLMATVEPFKKNGRESMQIKSSLVDTNKSPIKLHTLNETNLVVREVKERKSRVETKRICYDFKILLIWMFSWAIMILITTQGLIQGNLYKILYPYDSYGLQCGIDLIDQTSLVYFNLSTTQSYKRCITTCPSKSNNTVCKYNTVASSLKSELTKQINNGSCAFIAKTNIAFFRCVPESLTSVTSFLNADQLIAAEVFRTDFANQTAMTKLFNKLFAGVVMILVCSLTSIIVSILWYYLLLTLGTTLLYISYFLLIFILFGLVLYFVYIYLFVFVFPEFGAKFGFIVLNTVSYSETGIIAGMAITGTGLLGACLYAYISKKSIRLAGRIIQEAGRFITPSNNSHLKALWFVPLFSTLLSILALMLVYFTLLLTGVLFTAVDTNTGILGFKSSRVVVNLYIAILAFWFVWNLAIIYAFGRVSTARAVSKVYWTSQVNCDKRWMFMSSGWILIHHLGSIAWGVVVIPLSVIANWIEYSIRPSFTKAEIVEEVEQEIVDDNWTDRIRKGLADYLATVNSWGFIQMALHDGDFLEACLITPEVVMPSLKGISKMGSIITWMCIISVSALTIVVSIFISANSVTIDSDLPMLVVVGSMGILVASIFLQGFAISVDTILYCYSEDLEFHDGTSRNPYAMSKSLQKFLTEVRKTPREKKLERGHANAREKAAKSAAYESPLPADMS
jgi:hypothetical protein